eukprot:1207060-Rhodomonas_salina.3
MSGADVGCDSIRRHRSKRSSATSSTLHGTGRSRTFAHRSRLRNQMHKTAICVPFVPGMRIRVSDFAEY